MPVGNDVVDLRHPLCQHDSIHPRFDSRAFSAAEIADLGAAVDVHRTRWSLWAAKESAFKAARKLAPGVGLIPRDFAVHLSGARAEVIHRIGRFDVWFDHADEWVHAMASQDGRKPDFRVDGDRSADPGAAETHSGKRVRELATDTLGAVLNIAPGELRIVSVDHLPRVHRQGAERGEASSRSEPLAIDLSLSHDGRFVACAWEMGDSGPGHSPDTGPG